MHLFDRDYSGGAFVLWGPTHLVTLAIIVVACALVPLFRRSSQGTHDRIRIGTVAVLWANELGWHLWQALNGEWDLQNALPLQLCSIFVWVDGILLLTRSRRLYPFALLLGLPGAIQALATPAVLGAYGFPHYRYLMFFLAHGLLVAIPLWFTWVEGFRPEPRDLVRVPAVAIVAAAAVMALNFALGSNYMFLNGKPPGESLLSLLPAWPGYLPYLVGIAVVAILLTYAPFAVGRLLRPRADPAGTSPGRQGG